MITIVMDANKSLKINSTVPIYQFETNADEILCLLPSMYGSLDLINYEVKLCFSNGEHKGNTLMSPEKYNENYLSYKCPISLDMTAYSGQLSIWIEVTNDKKSILLKTNTTMINVIETIKMDDTATEQVLPLLNRWTLDMIQIKNSAYEILKQATEQANSATKTANLIIRVLQDIQGGGH